MRRRITLILLFPVFAIIFVVGWVLYVVGDKPVSNNAALTRKLKDSDSEKELTTNDEVVIGAIEEEIEENNLSVCGYQNKVED